MSLARISTSLTAAVFFAALTACAERSLERVDAAKIQQTTRTSVAGHLNQINDAIQLVADGAFFTDLEEIFDPENTSDGPLSGFDEEEVGELATAITERLFGADTVELETETRVVYRVSGARICEGDETCLRVFANVPIRLDVTSPREGALDINVVAGNSEVIPFMIHLDPARVAVDVDLPSMRTLAEELAPYLDYAVSDIPSHVSGNFTVSLTQNDHQDYTAALLINEKIESESTNNNFPARIKIAAKNTPVVSLRLNGNERRVYGDVDFAAIDAGMPAAFLLEQITCSIDETDCGPFHGTFAAHLAGISASVELTRTLDRLLVTNVGLGDETSRLTLDQTDLLTVDLNALYDRRFDVELSTFDEFVIASITNAFTLDLGLDFASLEDQVPELPAWTAHDRVSISFTGATPEILMGDGEDVVIGGRETTMIARVARGDLSFTSEQVSPVEVEGAECLYATVNFDEHAHPFSALVSSLCP
jgi:hypothetical protein